mmetsp:Transcript_13765/g.36370  ORF Transcript_13765/g.36370 Transcript_13765/m.36370 type:complete len:215 (+) Transcript_13765:265-909(+)
MAGLTTRASRRLARSAATSPGASTVSARGGYRSSRAPSRSRIASIASSCPWTRSQIGPLGAPRRPQRSPPASGRSPSAPARTSGGSPSPTRSLARTPRGSSASHGRRTRWLRCMSRPWPRDPRVATSSPTTRPRSRRSGSTPTRTARASARRLASPALGCSGSQFARGPAPRRRTWTPGSSSTPPPRTWRPRRRRRRRPPPSPPRRSRSASVAC